MGFDALPLRDPFLADLNISMVFVPGRTLPLSNMTVCSCSTLPDDFPVLVPVPKVLTCGVAAPFETPN
jgi:hypothetical protein